MHLKTYFWLVVKVVLLFVLLTGGSFISELRDEDVAPPLWISPIVLLLCFCWGLFVRAASQTQVWTEQQLWLANPFRYVLKPWVQEAFYYPPFFHFGAMGFIAGGMSNLLSAAFSRPVMVGHGATILAMGIGLWLGIRLRDLLRTKNAEAIIAAGGSE